jgi:hypothetical protein
MNYVGPFNLLIPNGVLKNGSDVFNVLDPDSGGAKTFSVALSANGLEPATHWGARSVLLEETRAAIQDMTVQEFKAFVDQKVIDTGRAPVGSITAFKNNLLIDEGNFWEFVAAQGLQAVATEI